MRLLLSGLLFLAGAAQAAAPATISSIAFEGKSERGVKVAKNAVRMPLVQHADPQVAARINDRLFIDTFGNLAPVKPAATFGKADGIKLEGLEHNEYFVDVNDGRLLSFRFHGEGCGAYCESFASYASFDLRDGRLIRDIDIFTPAGITALNQQIDNERLRQYRKQLASLQKQLHEARKDRSAKGKEIIVDLNDRVALNTDCERNLAEKIKAGYAERPRVGAKLEIGAKEISFMSSRCSNHASLALDDVGEADYANPHAKLAPYYTAYGKALFLRQGDARPAPTLDGQVVRGTIGGNMPVTMLLEDAGSEGWNGKYFYDKYRKPIDLVGKANGKEIVLTEVSEDPAADKATLRFSLSGDKASGQFIGKKTYALEIKP